jgi:hypothetical protein
MTDLFYMTPKKTMLYNIISDKTCPICLDEIDYEHCYITDCGHLFDLKCITTYLYDENTCPTCKTDVTVDIDSFIEIFKDCSKDKDNDKDKDEKTELLLSKGFNIHIKNHYIIMYVISSDNIEMLSQFIKYEYKPHIDMVLMCINEKYFCKDETIMFILSNIPNDIINDNIKELVCGLIKTYNYILLDFVIEKYTVPLQLIACCISQAVIDDKNEIAAYLLTKCDENEIEERNKYLTDLGSIKGCNCPFKKIIPFLKKHGIKYDAKYDANLDKDDDCSTNIPIDLTDIPVDQIDILQSMLNSDIAIPTELLDGVASLMRDYHANR